MNYEGSEYLPSRQRVFKEKTYLPKEILYEEDRMEWVEALAKLYHEGFLTKDQLNKEVLRSKKFQIEVKDDYTVGYEDGLNMRKNTAKFNTSDDYRKGWEDGRGDKLYEND